MDDRASVIAWLEEWQRRVRTEDYAGAEALFAADLVGFGTRAAALHGRAEVVARQWREVWPHTHGFRFRTQELELVASGDRRLAVAMVPWDSVGRDPHTGAPFDRPGRATVVLERASPEAPWRGVHTHFSLVPGTSEVTLRRD